MRKRIEDDVVALARRLDSAERTISLDPTESIGNWQAMSLGGGWSNVGGQQAAEYTRDSSGFVHVRGTIGGGSGTVFTLPNGYRPLFTIILKAAADILSHVIVTPAGVVLVSLASGASNAQVGINFMFPTAEVPGEELEWRQSQWGIVPNNTPVYGYPRLVEHRNGMLCLCGVLAGGINTDTSPVFGIPGSRVLGGDGVSLVHVPGLNGVGSVRLDIGGGSAIFRASPGNNTQMYLEGVKLPGPRTFGKWLPLPMEAGWTWYGGEYRTLGYMKDKAGQVFLKGLAAGTGGVGAVVATLPVDYRPPATVLLRTVASVAGASNSCLVTVNSSGQVTLGTAVSGWVSLDEISFHTT